MRGASRPALFDKKYAPALASLDFPLARIDELHFNVNGCNLLATDSSSGDDTTASSLANLASLPQGYGSSKRKYRRVKAQVNCTWRTRADPFASVWDEVHLRLETAPERTAKAIFLDLQQLYPGRYAAGQVRTVQ